MVRRSFPLKPNSSRFIVSQLISWLQSTIMQGGEKNFLGISISLAKLKIGDWKSSSNSLTLFSQSEPWRWRSDHIDYYLHWDFFFCGIFLPCSWSWWRFPCCEDLVVSFFMWIVFWNRCLREDNLMRGWLFQTSVWFVGFTVKQLITCCCFVSKPPHSGNVYSSSGFWYELGASQDYSTSHRQWRAVLSKRVEYVPSCNFSEWKKWRILIGYNLLW